MSNLKTTNFTATEYVNDIDKKIKYLDALKSTYLEIQNLIERISEDIIYYNGYATDTESLSSPYYVDTLAILEFRKEIYENFKKEIYEDMLKKLVNKF